MTNILITGSSGFVGAALVEQLQGKPAYSKIYTLSRRFDQRLSDQIHQIIADRSEQFFETPIPKNIDVIIHLAGRAHILNEQIESPLNAFRQVNVQGSIQLAKQALENKVKRFVFISSIGVNGAVTENFPFSETDIPRPHADYAVSKLEAEQALLELFKNTSTELVIIRPPLVYAADAPGNFARLLKLVSINLPLPFACVNNRRSFVSRENLVDFIECCISHPLAKDELFLISDTQTISTKQLVTALREGMGKTPNLFYIPNFVMKFAAVSIGKQKLYEQLFSSLEIDSSKAQTLLGWQPPLDITLSLQQVGQTYNKSK